MPLTSNPNFLSDNIENRMLITWKSLGEKKNKKVNFPPLLLGLASNNLKFI